MGNRAVIKIEGESTGIYLHWNGGVESVLGFLKAAKDLGVRDPKGDPSYCLARLTQIIGNFFGGTLSVGLGVADRMDNSDNGTFVIGSGFQIVRRFNNSERDTALTPNDLTGEQMKYCQGVYDETMRRNAETFKESI